MSFGGIEDGANWDDITEQGGGFDPIPVGWYDARIAEAKEDETRAGDACIKIQWEITGPKYAGRRLYQTLNTGHSKQKTRSIARGQLKTLTRQNGGEGFPKSGEQMVGWTAQIKPGFWETDDGQVNDSVDSFRNNANNDATGPYPDDQQPELYKKAMKGAPAPIDGDSEFDDGDDIPF